MSNFHLINPKQKTRKNIHCEKCGEELDDENGRIRQRRDGSTAYFPTCRSCYNERCAELRETTRKPPEMDEEALKTLLSRRW